MKADKKWVFTLIFTAFISIIIFNTSIYNFRSSYTLTNSHKPISTVHRGTDYPPAFAYYISGSRGDVDRIFRMLLAVYGGGSGRRRRVVEERGGGERFEVFRSGRSTSVWGRGRANLFK
ncbi:hypothetical protein Hanom_Chr11g01022891 [Helianthus anomalus]